MKILDRIVFFVVGIIALFAFLNLALWLKIIISVIALGTVIYLLGPLVITKIFGPKGGQSSPFDDEPIPEEENKKARETNLKYQ